MKKIFTLRNVLIVVAILAVLSMISLPRYIRNSRNEAARDLLGQIALAEMAMQTEAMACCSPPNYVYTDGES